MASDIQQKLKRRIRKLLWSNDAKPRTAAIKAGIADVVGRIPKNGWHGYIVGGTLRDVMLAPAHIFPRDIDVVVTGSSQAALERVFIDLQVRKTSFGGLHLVRRYESVGMARAQGDILFDLWRLEDTWGLREQGMVPSIENFVKTPFLNIDSVAMDIFAKNHRHRIVECGFFEALERRTLDINYEPNPLPLVCIVRSLLIAAKLEFGLSRRLASFVCAYLRWGTMSDLMDAQQSHYGQVRCGTEELTSWIAQIEASLATDANRIAFHSKSARQKVLWEAWPTVQHPCVSPGLESPEVVYRQLAPRRRTTKADS